VRAVSATERRSEYSRFTEAPEAGYIAVMDSSDLITVNPDILGGTPVFKGTRVPVKTLFEYLDNYSNIICGLPPRPPSLRECRRLNDE
jgi:hypothetical protein